MRILLVILSLALATHANAKERFNSWTVWQTENEHCRGYNKVKGENKALLDDDFKISNKRQLDVYVFVAMTNKGQKNRAYGGIALQGPKVTKSGSSKKEQYYTFTDKIYFTVDGGEHYYLDKSKNGVAAFLQEKEHEEVIVAMKRGSKGSIFGKLKTIDGEIVKFTSKVDLRGFTNAFNAFIDCTNK